MFFVALAFASPVAMADEKEIWGMRSKLMAHGDERFSMFLRENFH
jgi:hypothetical protein